MNLLLKLNLHYALHTLGKIKNSKKHLAQIMYFDIYQFEYLFSNILKYSILAAKLNVEVTLYAIYNRGSLFN